MLYASVSTRLTALDTTVTLGFQFTSVKVNRELHLEAFNDSFPGTPNGLNVIPELVPGPNGARLRYNLCCRRQGPQNEHGPNVNNFNNDLTSTDPPGLSNAVKILKIDPAVSDRSQARVKEKVLTDTI